MLKRRESRQKMAVRVPLKCSAHVKDNPIGNCRRQLVVRLMQEGPLESHSADPSGDLNPTLTDQHLSVCVFSILAPHRGRKSTAIMVKEF